MKHAQIEQLWALKRRIIRTGQSHGTMDAEAVAADIEELVDILLMEVEDHDTAGNPEHLWAGTQSDNMRDAASKGRHYWQKAVALFKKLESGYFTQEDVKVLKGAVQSAYSSMLSKDASEESAKLLSLADRIEALLPPEEK